MKEGLNELYNICIVHWSKQRNNRAYTSYDRLIDSKVFVPPTDTSIVVDYTSGGEKKRVT